MDNQKFTPEDEANLREQLKRCSPETVEKAVEFRKTGNKALAQDVVLGIVERFLEPDKKELLKDACDSLKFVSDLGLDSLTMMEIVLAIEDATGMTIDNEDVQKIQTVGDLKAYVAEKIK